jgi:lipopolysaccharide biosynthesis glycosyltransferase
MRLNVAFSTDSKYIIPATVAITSFLENNNSSSLSIYLLYIENELNDNDLLSLQILIESYNVEFIKLNVKKEMLLEMPKLRHGLSAYLRIFLPSLLSNVNLILYLDVDIVVDGNILDLFETDMNNYQLAAVPDVKPIFSPLFLNKIGYKNSGKYFCTGVLLMNLNELRRINLLENTKLYLNNYKDKIEHSDQDILNIVCDKIFYLHPKYNFIDKYFNKKCLEIWSKTELSDAVKKPLIIHYLGPSKPWQYINVHFFKKKWYKYLQITKYKNYSPLIINSCDVIKLRLKYIYYYLRILKKAI